MMGSLIFICLASIYGAINKNILCFIINRTIYIQILEIIKISENHFGYEQSINFNLIISSNFLLNNFICLKVE